MTSLSRCPLTWFRPLVVPPSLLPYSRHPPSSPLVYTLTPWSPPLFHSPGPFLLSLCPCSGVVVLDPSSLPVPPESVRLALGTLRLVPSRVDTTSTPRPTVAVVSSPGVRPRVPLTCRQQGTRPGPVSSVPSPSVPGFRGSGVGDNLLLSLTPLSGGVRKESRGSGNFV